MSPKKAPWSDWTPGVLAKDQVTDLCQAGYISGAAEPHFDQSSLDLTLSGEGYVMLEGAVKPFGDGFLNELQQQRLVQHLSPAPNGAFFLEPRQTYLFKLKERLERFPADSGIHGQATAKSSVGRVDVLARLIVDGMREYESFEPGALASGNGDLFLEITSLTFRVVVKPGISLSQLRLFLAEPSSCQVKGTEAFRCFIKNSAKLDGSLSVDLSPVEIRGHKVVAFCAQESDVIAEPIPLWPTDRPPDPCQFWRFVQTDDRQRVTLKKGSFYILRSKELLALPAGVAVYCRAIDETLGEMRIHYAGFVHPWFGRTRSDDRLGTPLIFEVRGHDVHTRTYPKTSLSNMSVQQK